MKINKFLIAGATVAMMSFGVQAQQTQNTQQEMNPTVAKTLNTFGGFLGALVQNAKSVVDTTAAGVSEISNSEGAQQIKNGTIKGVKVVSSSEIGKTVTQNTTVGVNAVSQGFKDSNKPSSEPTIVKSQETQNTQQEMNPTVAKTLNTFGSFLGALAQGAKEVVSTTAAGVSEISNSEGAQQIKKGTMKGVQFVSESEIGQTVTQTTKAGVNSISEGFKNSNQQNIQSSEPTIEAASVTPVSQAATTPSVSEGMVAAKNKVNGLINFLREKATTPDNGNNVKPPTP